jgi:peroxidase
MIIFYKRGALVITLTMLMSTLIFSQNRRIEGYFNNPFHSTWGAINENQLDVVPIGYTDGISTPAGINRPNAREISNTVCHQDGLIMDQNNLSDYAWVWGQFIDHDITKVGEDHTEPLNILVPMGDIYFDPLATGDKTIPMARSAYDPNSGTDIDNPRKFPNGITAFVDASNIYGVSYERMNWLRSFSQGKLKTSVGNKLPYNTLNGEIEGEIDPAAPQMAMANPQITKYFVSGDVRANENILLLSMHTLFMREHNRLCDILVEQHPTWSDEQIFYRAKKLVAAEISSIVFNEWLPSLGVHLEEYLGYDNTVNPGIFNVFSAAAYRYGHTVISSDIIRLDANGETITQGNIKLKDAFFNPQVFVDGGGTDPLFRGMSTQVEQDFDTKMINDLRNFLFGPPGAGGLDLAAINIQRGRERGLPDYNTVRHTFGMEKISTFDELTANPYLNTQMRNLYGDVDDIDPWIGFLSEDHMSNSLFGETVMSIMTAQFKNLRDGDSFYYLNDAELQSEDIDFIESSTLSSVIKRNTEVVNISDHVFTAHPMVVSTENMELLNEITISPNPSDGKFNVELPQGVEVEKYYILSNTGSKIMEKQIQNYSDIHSINIAAVSGLYHMVIITSEGMISRRIIIN